MDVRTCIHCKTSKDESAYRVVKAKGRPDWRESRCEECRKAYARKHYATHVELQRKYYAAKQLKRYHLSKANQAMFLYQRLKQRAAANRIAFSLSPADIVIPEKCPILGIDLRPAGNGPQVDETMSIDRLDPVKGYEPGNVSVISLRANRIKNNGTAEEHDRIAAWMRSKGVK